MLRSLTCNPKYKMEDALEGKMAGLWPYWSKTCLATASSPSSIISSEFSEALPWARRLRAKVEDEERGTWESGVHTKEFALATARARAQL